MKQSSAADAARVAQDLKILLNPREDATHKRDLTVSSPRVSFLANSRADVIAKILEWEATPLTWKSHVCWVYGGAGCGKSTIAQETAQNLEQKKKLAGSFFWSRSTQGRSKSLRLAATLAFQLATYVPKTAPLIEAALAANPDIFLGQVSLITQLEELIFGPFQAAWKKLPFMKPLGGSKRPFTFVLDGIDECQDTRQMIDLIKCLGKFFKDNPTLPLRFLITGRIEAPLAPYASRQEVCLIDLAQFNSKEDVDLFIRTSLAAHCETSRLSMGVQSLGEPPAEHIEVLDALVDGSFAVAAPLMRYILRPPTPSQSGDMSIFQTLPLTRSRVDCFYIEILESAKHRPCFMDVLSAITLLKSSISVSELARFVGTHNYVVMDVLKKISAIVDVPGTDDAPISLINDDIHGFLLDKTRSQSFYAQSTVLRAAAFGYLDMAIAHFQRLPEEKWALPLNKMVLTVVNGWSRHLDLVLEADPDFDVSGLDGRWAPLFSRIKFFPHFSTILAILAIAREPLQIANLCAIVQADIANISPIIYALAPLIARASESPTIAMSDRVSFRHREIPTFLLDKARAQDLCIEPSQYTQLTKRFMEIVFAVPIVFVNARVIFRTWPKLLAVAVANDPMFLRNHLEEPFLPVTADHAAQMDLSDGWGDAFTFILEAADMGTLVSYVEDAVEAIQNRYPKGIPTLAEIYMQIPEGKGKQSLVLASRCPVSTIDILIGFRALLDHKGDCARLCMLRGSGSGLQIERYHRKSGSSRFHLSLYRSGTDIEARSPRTPTFQQGSASTMNVNLSAVSHRLRRAKPAPLDLIPVASSSRIPEDSPPVVSTKPSPVVQGSSQLPYDWHSSGSSSIHAHGQEYDTPVLPAGSCPVRT